MEDFYSVAELSKLNKIPEETINLMISDILNVREEPLIVKNKKGYLIHKDIINLFTPKINKTKKKEPIFYGVSMIILGNYTEKDINKIMPLVFDSLNGDSDLELHYSINSQGYGIKDARANWQTVENMVYIYTNYSSFSLLINSIRLMFSEIKYKKKTIKDPSIWLNYMGRDNNAVIKLKRDGDYAKRKPLDEVFSTAKNNGYK